jgi:hypothetical protein
MWPRRRALTPRVAELQLRRVYLFEQTRVSASPVLQRGRRGGDGEACNISKGALRVPGVCSNDTGRQKEAAGGGRSGQTCWLPWSLYLEALPNASAGEACRMTSIHQRSSRLRSAYLSVNKLPSASCEGAISQLLGAEKSSQHQPPTQTRRAHCPASARVWKLPIARTHQQGPLATRAFKSRPFLHPQLSSSHCINQTTLAKSFATLLSIPSSFPFSRVSRASSVVSHFNTPSPTGSSSSAHSPSLSHHQPQHLTLSRTFHHYVDRGGKACRRDTHYSCC